MTVEEARLAARVGHRLSKLRQDVGLSLTELARRGGTDPASIGKYERGLKLPRIRTLLPILRAIARNRIVVDATVPGRRVRVLRQKHALTGPEFGRLVGAGKDQVCDWELGRIVPSLAALARICEVFGIDLGYFFWADNPDELTAKQRAKAMRMIGPRIRELCAARGLSFPDIEWRAGFGRNRIWPIVHGRKMPRGRTLLRIAAVLGIGRLSAGRARIEEDLAEAQRGAGLRAEIRRAMPRRMRRERRLPAQLFRDFENLRLGGKAAKGN